MAYQIQVRGEWAGSVGGWRPAIRGSLNQTGESDAEASTFKTLEDAQEATPYSSNPNTHFQIVDVDI